MKIAEKILISEISKAGEGLRSILRGLSIGQLIVLVRKGLKMSQRVLAKRAGIPQSTVARVEKSTQPPNLGTLHKILHALYCDLVLVPVLREPIDTIRRKQAHRKAEKQVRYLRGTMSLEKQEPDPKLLEELIKERTEELLRSPKLWEDDEKV